MTGVRNVFPLGKIVPSGDVVDRRSFILETKLRLLNGQSVMISGPRRIGKTSVCHEIMRQLHNEGCYVAQLDLMYVSSIEEFAAKLLQSILENRTGVLPQVAYAMQQLLGFFRGGEVRAKIHDLELGITVDGEDDAIEILETAFRTAETMAKKDDKRMVILLDEFQELDRIDRLSQGEHSLLKRLRSIFQRQEYTSYFFLGSESSLLNTIFADRRQAFYRFATLLQLPPIPHQEWARYIVAKLSEEHIGITDHAMQMLMERTGGHPYCVMSVMSNAYVTAQTNGMKEISAEVLHGSYEQSLDQLEAVYEEHWQEIRRFKGADSVLRSILMNRPIHSSDTSGNITRSVQNLIRLSVIEKGEHRGEYRILEPMFGDWVLKKIQGR